MEKEQKTEVVKNVPEKKFRAGVISATVWLNKIEIDSKHKRTWHAVVFQKGYKDADGNWQDTNAFGRDDLAKLLVVVGKAYEYVSLKEPEVTTITPSGGDAQ